MPQYRYRAKNDAGKMVGGSIKAQTEAEAVGDLRRQGLIVIHLTVEKETTGGRSSFLSFSLGGKKTARADRARVKAAEMVVFTRQLSTMISAGIPLVEALDILGEQTTNPGFRAVLEEVTRSVRSGRDLSQAFSAHARVFPRIYINMIKAGEASGQLDVVLARLADYQEAAEELKGEIKSAMTYPVVSLFLVGGIAAFLLIGIIPKFEEMFTTMDVKLPFITKALLSMSLFLKGNVLPITAALAAAVAVAIAFIRTDAGRLVMDRVILRLPIFGPLFSKVAISRFSRTFATLIRSGVPILAALEIVSDTAGNQVIARAIRRASDSVRQGEPLGEPLAQTRVFPPMVTRMISIGEKTGAMETLLEKISQFYDQQVKTTVESLTSLIEPLMIGVMGFLVGGMVMAIFLPIFKMVGRLSGKG
ncbi:MAG: type II secretion system F family protein [Planctomycetes bacterium]|nr:type II secretion system F family protein [Planctomycetota bacterium]